MFMKVTHVHHRETDHAPIVLHGIYLVFEGLNLRAGSMTLQSVEFPDYSSALPLPI